MYGQELLLPVVVEKISSSSEGLSDRQRIRVWKKGDSKSIVFFASKRDKAKRRYMTVHGWSLLFSTMNLISISLWVPS